jgi:hypothetical protein
MDVLVVSWRSLASLTERHVLDARLRSNIGGQYLDLFLPRMKVHIKLTPLVSLIITFEQRHCSEQFARYHLRTAVATNLLKN